MAFTSTLGSIKYQAFVRRLTTMLMYFVCVSRMSHPLAEVPL